MPDRSMDPLARWEPPPTPQGLKRRALAAAEDHDRRPVPRRIEDRLWESRTLRFGWLAAASVLLALNFAVGTGEHRQELETADRVARPTVELDVGIDVPASTPNTWTVAEAQAIVDAMLNDPCLDPMAEGDCT
jgi:hypothetical protein